MLPPKKSNKKPNPVKKYKKTIFVDPNTEEGRLRHEAFKDSLILSTNSDPENWYNNEHRKMWMKDNPHFKGKNILLDPERVKRALANKPIGTKKILSEKGGYIIHHQVKTVNGKKISDTVVGKTKEKDKYRVKNVYASPQIEVKFLKPNKDKSRVITPIEQLELPLPKFVDIPKIEFPTSIITNTTTEPAVETSAVTPVKKGFVDKFYNTDPARGKVEKPGTEPNVRYRPVSNSFELKKWQEQQLAYGTNSQGIMKTKMNPRKKYAQGTNAKGMDPNHYIISPAEALNDYNIMLAKAEAEAVSNPWLPAVAIGGELLQTGIGLAGNYNQKRFSSPTAAMGMNDVQEDVEVEGGEMYETPQGEVGEFQGPSHEQGGIPLEVGQDVEEGTKVYSDRLKVGKKTLAERKATRERQVANLEKIASNNLADQAVKNAAKRKMMAIEKEEANDLAFQEQVNNMQAMADTMVMAFGTGIAGIQDNPIGDSMRYGYGSGSKGIMKYDLGTGEDGIDPPMTMQEIQTIIGSNPDGTWGRRDRRKARQFVKDKDQSAFPSWAKGGRGITKDQSSMEIALADEDIQKQFRRVYLGEPFSQEELDAQAQEDSNQKAIEAEEDAAFYTPGQVGTPKVNKPGTVFSRTASKVGEAVGKMGVPGMGDMTKLIGNYLGMTSGIKTAAEQRSTDVTHTNVFANAGKESQKLLDNAKQGIETSKAQAIVKATDVGRGGKRGARGSARGVNQMRAMDWLYDTALQSQIAEISANAAQQISGIDTQKSSVAMSADQLKGQGEYQAAMANEAAKDAYYTALGLGRKDFATGLQQSGADLNDMKENKILENLLGQDGEYVGMTAKGNFFGKPAKVKGSKTSSTNVEIPDGKGGKITLTQEEYKKLMAELTKSK